MLLALLPTWEYSNPNCKQVARLTGTSLFLDGVAKGKQAETALGILTLKEPAIGSGTILLRPEEMRFVVGEGDARVEFSNFTGPGFLLSVEMNGLCLRIPHQKLLPVGCLGAIEVIEPCVFW